MLLGVRSLFYFTVVAAINAQLKFNTCLDEIKLKFGGPQAKLQVLAFCGFEDGFEIHGVFYTDFQIAGTWRCTRWNETRNWFMHVQKRVFYTDSVEGYRDSI